MDELWKSFKGWLEEHYPAGLTELNPPAQEEDIAKLEETLACTLPADYVACLKVHNGQSGNGAWLFAGQQFLSTQDVAFQWGIWKGLLDQEAFAGISSEPTPEVKPHWWSPLWVPFTFNGAGDHLCLDLDPSEQGTHGQIITMWHDDGLREQKADSFTLWFTNFVDEVLANNYLYSDDYGALMHKDEL